MNRDEQFEKRLQRQPLREVPPTWRGEILAAARNVETSRRTSCLTSPSLLAILRQRLAPYFWPHPVAWAGLAAAWVVILAANFAIRDGKAATTIGHRSPPSPQVREMLKQQGQLLAELVGEGPAADRANAAPPRPHSFYRNEFLNA